jgi:hypothetical protein
MGSDHEAVEEGEREECGREKDRGQEVASEGKRTMADGRTVSGKGRWMGKNGREQGVGAQRSLETEMVTQSTLEMDRGELLETLVSDGLRTSL